MMRPFKPLYMQVLIGVAIGALLGFLAPHLAIQMKSFGDLFVGLIHLLVAPLVFCTVTMGVARVSNLGQAGRISVTALLYFLVVSTFALVFGLVIGMIVQPGAGMHINPATLSMAGLEKYRPAQSTAGGFIEMWVHSVPTNFIEPFLHGEIIQIVVLAVGTGAVLSGLGERGKPVADFLDSFMQVLFGLVRMVMRIAPLGAFGAIAFSIGQYGIHTLVSLGWLVGAMYLASVLFVVVLGLISALWCRVSIFSLLRYFRTELLVVLGTSSSETVFARLMEKLEALGCSPTVVGLVLPTGYSFNLDGGQIYLSLAALFISQALDIHLSVGQLVSLCLVMFVTSKGSAGVSGAAFIVLASSLSSTSVLPVAGLTLVLGADRFMSQARSLVNVLGCVVATIFVARREGGFDAAYANEVMAARVADRGDSGASTTGGLQGRPQSSPAPAVSRADAGAGTVATPVPRAGHHEASVKQDTLPETSTACGPLNQSIR
jgi:aerobic C4-dicarboxylate transport protein